MKFRLSTRILPLTLSLALLLSPAAQALNLEQARMLLDQYYIDDLPPAALEADSIQAMIDALGDPYTYYFTPEEYQLFDGSMKDQDIVGIGISAQTVDEGLVLVRVYENTPAAEAGLQPGDIITNVDGRPAAGESSDTLTSWIQGPENTQVTLICQRGDTEYSAKITRRAIVIPATTGSLWQEHIGYIDCNTFGDETLAHFIWEIQRYDAQTDHWVVDMRSNTGGIVDAAVQAAGTFIGPETLAYLQDSSRKYFRFNSENPALTEDPVIVLVDQNTASAAELFAAAVRDSGAGLVIGARTFGKGVAQSVFDQNVAPDLFPDGDAIKITSFRFYSGAGVTDDLIGVIPHLLLPPSLADEAAILLCAPPPEGDNSKTLRLDLVGQWYIDLEQALSEEYRLAFTTLLEALPPDADLFAGTGSDWTRASGAELAQQYALAEYEHRGFTDSGTSRFSTELDMLGAYGVLFGSGDGTVQPFEKLSRAQLCALLAQALNVYYPSSGVSRFSDVPMDAWYGPAVNSLAEMGLVSGVGGGLFRPEDPVSHEQLITIMSRLGQHLCIYLDLKGRNAPEAAVLAEELPEWSEWSREHVWLLSASQETEDGSAISLLWDPVGSIAPDGETLRGEAAALTCCLFVYMGLLP